MDKLKDLAGQASGGQQGGNDMPKGGGGGGGGGIGGMMEDKAIDQRAFLSFRLLSAKFSPYHPSSFSLSFPFAWVGKISLDSQLPTMVIDGYAGVDQEASDMGIPSSADGAINKEVNQEVQKEL